MAHHGSDPAYLQPVAAHRREGTRLIARDEEGSWWLWHGDRAHGRLEAIPAPLAGWMLDRLEMQVLPSPCFWFQPEALPVRAAVDTAPADPSRFLS